jgi:hypothetical protein
MRKIYGINLGTTDNKKCRKMPKNTIVKNAVLDAARKVISHNTK